MAANGGSRSHTRYNRRLNLSEFAEVLYKTSTYWKPAHERSIAWNDPELTIDWPLTQAPLLSARDAAAMPFRQAPCFDWHPRLPCAGKPAYNGGKSST